jgi:[ribosomal protein S5]-alanine N-acetyltransferase
MSTETAAVRLVAFAPEAVRALADGDLAAAGRAVGGLTLPGLWLEGDWLWLWRLRAAQIEEDPDSARWLLRAVVLDPDTVVGHAGFHGPPDERGMVEVGYSILEGHRRRGYAAAALSELMAYARGEGARVVRASIAPDNVPSLALARRFGFAHVGEQWDERDGRELLFERPLTP